MLFSENGIYFCYKMYLILLPLLVYLTSASAAFPYVYPRIKLARVLEGDAGTPLFLTPYLLNGSINEAQNLSKVSITSELGFESHAGFFTVNEKYQSNLYFWYFPSFSKDPAAPVILWLQGGPGGSSLFGLFAEIGPLIAKKDGFKLRKHHWALNSHLIFIDNPVGTGFSFTNKNQGYCSDEKCVAVGLYCAMQQFFTLFPTLRSHKFFITGESYAGKYVPALAMEIHQQKPVAEHKINLQGMAMGNAYCDPINQLDYGNYLYQHGLLDDNQLQVFETLQTQIADEISKENWARADVLMDLMMDGGLTNFSYFTNYTGFNNYYNFLKTADFDYSAFAKLLQNKEARKSIHVGNLPFHSGKEVQKNLALDLLKSVASYVGTLLSYYPILIYNGQLDIIVAYPLTEKFLQNLNFSAAEEYKMAPRKIWTVGADVAGYVKKAGNLTEVLVRNAGHMVPHDQPKWALDMITRFTRGKM